MSSMLLTLIKGDSGTRRHASIDRIAGGPKLLPQPADTWAGESCEPRREHVRGHCRKTLEAAAVWSGSSESLAYFSRRDSAVRLFEDAFMSDPALTAELLVMANSAAFGGRSRVQTIGMAIRNLGLERVRSLATTSALRSHTQRGPDQQYLASVWAHGVATAVAAEALGELSGFPDLYTLGLTHDLGRLGLFLAGGQAYAVALSQEFLDIEQADQAERNLFGVTHCQAGAVVAAVWGFPDSLAACMGQHHSGCQTVREA